PAFARHEQAATLDRILRVAAERGFRELDSQKLRTGLRDAQERWQAHRERAWSNYGGPPTGSDPSSFDSCSFDFCCSARSAPTVDSDDPETGGVRGRGARVQSGHTAHDQSRLVQSPSRADPTPAESGQDPTSEAITRRTDSPRAERRNDPPG